MNTNITGALPTENIKKANNASNAQLFTKHYLEHKISDIPGSKNQSNIN